MPQEQQASRDSSSSSSNCGSFARTTDLPVMVWQMCICNEQAHDFKPSCLKRGKQTDTTAAVAVVYCNDCRQNGQGHRPAVCVVVILRISLALFRVILKRPAHVTLFNNVLLLDFNGRLDKVSATSLLLED